ncbi:type I-E CRISPR-associated protein Cas6/Cse3/CasE [Vibrio spartinae]|uniref:CRISPR system Cascade subunit CasE n=1 Tax=Vibrio spartinae TaxID=1918945 RepID=A0A1N6LYZ7_9VIBR|nr:type I-E CRISPR-associated protein Cas6/Cse3/CasE [Vibrio spartinae]QMV16521.1 CRISPR system Cascade subunit CasE [Vibrio spartinae]SIO92405.1 CRISPR system Cascade subunit CasE [Vibrio spartinae]
MQLYLSKITLSPSANLAKILLELDHNDAYASHQLLWRELFHRDEKRQFIYRQEVNSHQLPLFYTLSKTQPDPYSRNCRVESKIFAPQLQVGQQLAYQLRVNPTICITKDGHQHRHDVVMHTKHQLQGEKLPPPVLKQQMDEAIHQWLGNETRLTRWGIELVTVPDIQRYTQHRSYKKKRREKHEHHVRFSSVDVQGILSVTDPERFLSQYAEGFGREKAMGCGLMLIRRT